MASHYLLDDQLADRASELLTGSSLLLMLLVLGAFTAHLALKASTGRRTF